VECLAVRDPAVVLAPRHLASVGVQVPAAHVVMLAPLGTTQAREVAFRLIGSGRHRR